MRDKQAVLRTIEFRDIEPDLPRVVPLSTLQLQADVFLTSLGFEERAVSIPAFLSQRLAASNPKVLCLLAQYSSNLEDNEVNRGQLLQHLSTFCDETRTLPADQPGDLSVALQESLTRRKPADRPLHVVVDISTASGNLTLSIMSALIEWAEASPLHLTIAYSEPEEYFPTWDEYASDSEKLVLTACKPGDNSSVHEFGVAEVDFNELYPGKNIENREEFIIAVPAYRTERLSRCLQTLTDQPLADPDKFIFWIFGVPPETGRKFRLDMQRRVITSLLRSMSGHEHDGIKAVVLSTENSAEASTLHYADILRIAIEAIDREAGKNISVVHMGSKMQAVGMSLALAARSEVTVCHARPDRYNAALYSRGIGSTWGVGIANLGELVSQVRRIGTLEFTTRIDAPR